MVSDAGRGGGRGGLPVFLLVLAWSSVVMVGCAWLRLWLLAVGVCAWALLSVGSELACLLCSGGLLWLWVNERLCGHGEPLTGFLI